MNGTHIFKKYLEGAQKGPPRPWGAGGILCPGLSWFLLVSHQYLKQRQGLKLLDDELQDYI